MYTTQWVYTHETVTTIKVIGISIASKSFLLPPLLLLLINVIFVIRAINIRFILLESFKYTMQYC